MSRSKASMLMEALSIALLLASIYMFYKSDSMMLMFAVFFIVWSRDASKFAQWLKL